MRLGKLNSIAFGFLLGVMAVIGLSTSLSANSIILKCKDSSGVSTADLTIDVAKRKMFWGSMEYDIVGVDDTYISAYQKPSGVGGEIWVINRISGVYKRGSVGIYFSEDQKPDEGSFEAQTYQGHCGKQQF
jgi:hypothetical protein